MSPGRRRDRRPRRPGHARRRRRAALTLSVHSPAEGRRLVHRSPIGALARTARAFLALPACGDDGPLATATPPRQRGAGWRRSLLSSIAVRSQHAAARRRPRRSLHADARPAHGRLGRRPAPSGGRGVGRGTPAAVRPSPRGRRAGRRRPGRAGRLVGIAVPSRRPSPVPLSVARAVHDADGSAGGSTASTRARHRLRPPPVACPPRIRTSRPVWSVDVAGKVRRPGIVELPAGSRVVDALAAAGGARPGVDTAGLNLARPLVDGEQIVVGLDVPSGPPASAGVTAAGRVDRGRRRPASTSTPRPDASSRRCLASGRSRPSRSWTGAPRTAPSPASTSCSTSPGIGEATLADIEPYVHV